MEVIDHGDEGIVEDYKPIGAVTEFKFSSSISNVFQGNDKLTYLKNWGPGWSFFDGGVPIVFVDNHDTQRDYGKLIYRKSKQFCGQWKPEHGINTCLAWPSQSPDANPTKKYVRINKQLRGTHVLSLIQLHDKYRLYKYKTGELDGQLPRGKAYTPPQDNDGNLLSPKINQDDTCGNGFICEHRWRQIYDMEHREGHPLTNWWSNGDQQIAFCRGNKGFVAFTNWADLKETLQTCLPAGKYCDVISGNMSNGKCTGKTVTVQENGEANIQLSSSDEDGVLAIHSIHKW
ncbi:hypothetical protein NQ318_015392 [Aromia moschata]|uniref:alpha-amylase n=1 Tax=Aromia moschata TaxID=1265417 RepID=A0AAV8YQU2_9CUCU|nr:hypothetical protein NQ318_015392 [Aromia moschata]